MDNLTKKDEVKRLIKNSIDLKHRVMEMSADAIVQMADAIVGSIRGGGKLLLCGNGGSAADAQHLAAELLVRLRPHVNRSGISAMALATDMSSITACGNDYDFNHYYERMVQALGRPGDVLLAITTSGKSINIIRSLAVARERGMVALGLLGCDGGDALAKCDIAIVVPSEETGRIQESHIMIGHAIMELVEDGLLQDGTINTQ